MRGTGERRAWRTPVAQPSDTSHVAVLGRGAASARRFVSSGLHHEMKTKHAFLSTVRDQVRRNGRTEQCQSYAKVPPGPGGWLGCTDRTPTRPPHSTGHSNAPQAGFHAGLMAGLIQVPPAIAHQGRSTCVSSKWFGVQPHRSKNTTL
jgi:hypothetical protein|eukprot:4038260-Prymnesium_polylepis.1